MWVDVLSYPKIGLFECRIAVLAVQENACHLEIPIFGINVLNIEPCSFHTKSGSWLLV
jgi:hypothetical protein